MHASVIGMYPLFNINWTQTPHNNKLVGTLDLKTYTEYILPVIASHNSWVYIQS